MTASDRRRFENDALPLHDNLYGAAMRLTRDPDEAADLVQDTFVRAFRFWETFKQGTNLKAWMFTILRNTFINGYHKRGRARSFEHAMNGEVQSAGEHAAVGYSHAQPPGPEESLALQSTQEAIREALDQLPADYRRVIELADLEGLSYKEIAEATEAPIGTVMSRIYRARRQLHALLYDHARALEIVSDEVEPGARRTRYARNPICVEVAPEPEPQMELALW